MPQKDKNVLVTGGAGYIGSHVCYALKQSGYTPVCFDNLSKGHEWAIKFGPFFKGDLLQTDSIKAAMETYAPMGVIHLASFIQVGESVEKPLLYYQQNVQSSLNLVDAMLAYDVSSLVFSSSAAVYGDTDGTPITETHIPVPKNPYGATKYLVERFLQDIAHSTHFNYCALRYFNAAGGHPSEGIGEAHDPETHLIPLLLRAGLKNTPFHLLGNSYPTPDGTCVRDYVHVMDLAEAHVQAFEYIQKTKEDVVLNLGSGQGTSIYQVIKVVEKILQKKLNVKTAPGRPGDPAYLVASIEKAKSILNWGPKRNLEQIIQDALAWEQRPHE